MLRDRVWHYFVFLVWKTGICWFIYLAVSFSIRTHWFKGFHVRTQVHEWRTYNGFMSEWLSISTENPPQAWCTQENCTFLCQMTLISRWDLPWIGFFLFLLFLYIICLFLKGQILITKNIIFSCASKLCLQPCYHIIFHWTLLKIMTANT